MQSPLHYSNVRLVDPVTGKKVRTISRFQADGSKVGAHPCACMPSSLVCYCLSLFNTWAFQGMKAVHSIAA